MRYGDAVLTISVSTAGRIGRASADALRDLARAAEMASGMAPQANARFMTWRQVFERTVLWQQADIVLLALGRNASRWYSDATAKQRRAALAAQDEGDGAPCVPVTA